MQVHTGTPEHARIAVFAHTPVMAAGLSDLLRDTPGTTVVGATTELDDLVAFVVDQKAEVVVTEVRAESGDATLLFEAIGIAARREASRPTVVCVIPSPAAVALDLKRRGAAAVVAMTDDPDVLRRAVVDVTTTPDVAAGPRTESPDVPAPAALTARELEVLQGMVDGYSSRLIADHLGVTVNTVRTHVQRLLPKLGAHNRLRAAAIAIELGLVTPSASRRRPHLDL